MDGMGFQKCSAVVSITFADLSGMMALGKLLGSL